MRAWVRRSQVCAEPLRSFRTTAKLDSFHHQRSLRNQDKLLGWSRAVIIEVDVDAQSELPSYGRYIAVELSVESGAQIFVPKWFLRSFFILTEDCCVHSKRTDVYASDCGSAVACNLPGVDWVTSFKGSPMRQDQVANMRRVWL